MKKCAGRGDGTFAIFPIFYVGALAKFFWSHINGYKVDTYRTVNGQTFVVCAAAHQTYTHQNKSEIGLHHGIFVFRHLGEMLNTLL